MIALVSEEIPIVNDSKEYVETNFEWTVLENEMYLLLPCDSLRCGIVVSLLLMKLE